MIFSNCDKSAKYVCIYLLKKNLYIGGPMQFKSISFKGQLYYYLKRICQYRTFKFTSLGSELQIKLHHLKNHCIEILI